VSEKLVIVTVAVAFPFGAAGYVVGDLTTRARTGSETLSSEHLVAFSVRCFSSSRSQSWAASTTGEPSSASGGPSLR